MLRSAIGTALMLVGARLTAQSGRSSMTGIVFDPSETHGIAEATVLLTGDPGTPRLATVAFTTPTDEEGHYSFNRLPYGDYLFRVSAPGFVPYQVNIYIAPDAQTALHVKLRAAQ